MLENKVTKIKLEHDDIKMDMAISGLPKNELEKVMKQVMRSFQNSFIAKYTEEVHTDAQEAPQQLSMQLNEQQAVQDEKDGTSENTQPEAADTQPAFENNSFAAAYQKLSETELAQLAALPEAEAAGEEEEETIVIAGQVVPRYLEGLDARTWRMKNGRILLQTYYICPNCKHKQRAYMYRGNATVSCSECSHAMKMKPAAKGNFPHVDGFGNFFVAGDFVREEERATILQRA